MNPYAKILSLLVELPAEERLLLSGVRRGDVGTRECGCLFGTLLPKHGLSAADGPPGSYYAGLLFQRKCPLLIWGHDLFDLTANEFRCLVGELERVNDGYDEGYNDARTCADRYQHVCNYLRKREAEYAENAKIPEPFTEEE